MSQKNPRIGELVRNELLANPEGLTVRQISDHLSKPQDLIIATLRRTYGCYVGGWMPNQTGYGNFVSVWMCAPVPESVPNPRGEMDAAELRAKAERSAAERLERLREMRARQKAVNATLKAKRDAEKARAKEMRAKIKEEVAAVKAAERAEREAKAKEKKRITNLQPAAPAGYQPAKTRWVTPPPWSN